MNYEIVRMFLCALLVQHKSPENIYFSRVGTIKEIIREHYYRSKNPETTTVSGFSLCSENGFGANLVQLSMKQYHTI